MNAGAAPTATTSATDADLVDAVRAGDEQAFEELYRRYRPRVFAFVRRRVRDDGRAEDLTQEAFLSALRRLRETESRVRFRPWIYEIARNATIDHFRRSARADEVSVDEPLPPSDYLRFVSPYGPDREVAAKQDLETLRGAFDELSDRHERILVMREFEGLSYREIGERMQLTRPGVESTLFRARRRLQSEFAELETGRRCATVRGAVGRLADGLELRGDRALVKRHIRRCAGCRTTARELGIVLDRPSRAARAAAVLPLPFVPGALGAKAAAAVVAVALAAGGAGIGALSAASAESQPLSGVRAATVDHQRPTARRALGAPVARPAPAAVAGGSVARAMSARLHRPSRRSREVPSAGAAPAARPEARPPAARTTGTPHAGVTGALENTAPHAPLLQSVPRSLAERGATTLRGVLRVPRPRLPVVPAVPPGP